jgi:signal transduction histidine kinase
MDARRRTYDELRTQFTAAVSHELRTPVARVLALLDTALLPDADTRTLVERAREEVEDMGELIDDVLFLSELETGREVVALGTTRAAPLLEQGLTAVRESAERAGVTLSLDADPELELPLRPRMLRVLVQNLVVNAIRHAGPGTTFTLSLRRDGEDAVLSARDDGVGVPDVELPRLFERFYRGDRARTSRGTGLGLAIVKHIVTAAGGTVEARRPTGGGLEIRCEFPGYGGAP